MIDRVIGVIVAFIALGSLAVVLSKRSDTAKVFGVLAKGLNDLFKTAVSPIVK